MPSRRRSSPIRWSGYLTAPTRSNWSAHFVGAGAADEGNWIDAIALIRRRQLLKLGGYSTDARLAVGRNMTCGAGAPKPVVSGVHVPEVLAWRQRGPAPATPDVTLMRERFPQLLLPRALPEASGCWTLCTHNGRGALRGKGERVQCKAQRPALRGQYGVLTVRVGPGRLGVKRHDVVAWV